MTISLKETLDVLMGNLNVMGRYKNEDIVADWFARQHRTLQQQFFKVVILPIIQHLAEMHREGTYDARNERSCYLAHKMADSIARSDTHIPLI